MNAKEALLAAAVGPIARDADGPVFREPWEAQAFAVVLALHEARLFGWSEWTAALARRIGRSRSLGDDGDDYYRRWLDALEDLLIEKGVTCPEALAARKAAWARAAEATPHGRPILLANDPEAREGSDR